MPSSRDRAQARSRILGPSRMPDTDIPVRMGLPAQEQAEEGEDDREWYVFNSSRVAEAAYDRENSTLYVRFVKPVPGLVEYAYTGVTPNQWQNFRRSPSPGRYINNVLNSYPYEQTN